MNGLTVANADPAQEFVYPDEYNVNIRVEFIENWLSTGVWEGSLAGVYNDGRNSWGEIGLYWSSNGYTTEYDSYYSRSFQVSDDWEAKMISFVGTAEKANNISVRCVI